MLVDGGIETDTTNDSLKEKHSINRELGELTKYVEKVTATIREMESPVTTTSDQLPQATAHLSDLAKMTEEGVHKAFSLMESIGENRGVLRSGLEQLREELPDAHRNNIDHLLELVKADGERLVNAHVALSFQDLVAQRVAKLVTILNEVQHKLLKLVVVFGIEQKKAGVGTESDSRAYEMLRQLDASKTTDLQQDLVDDILSEFGLS